MVYMINITKFGDPVVALIGMLCNISNVKYVIRGRNNIDVKYYHRLRWMENDAFTFHIGNKTVDTGIDFDKSHFC